jgi:hypothetical protein
MNLLLDYGSTSETEEPQIVKKINVGYLTIEL